MPRALTLGEALGVFRAEGMLRRTDSVAVGTGGAEANVAIGLTRLGVPCTFVGRIGDDGIGARIRDTLESERVPHALTVDPAAATGVLLKESPAPGRTAVTYHRAASAGSRVTRSDVERLDLEGVEMIHITGITPALSRAAAFAVDALIARAREVGARVSFDVNHRSKLWRAEHAAPAYRRLTAAADILFAGLDEARLVTGSPSDDVAELAEALHTLGAVEVVIKRGSRGAFASSAGATATAAAIAVDVVDTVGAGDAFVAGYLAATLDGAGIEARLDLAVHAGAAACTAPGDWEGAPTREGIERLRRSAAGRTVEITADEPVDR